MFGTRYFCVCGPKLLVSGEPVLFQKKLLWVYGQGPFVPVTRVFVSVYGPGPFGSGASSLFGTNFCWFGSRNRFSFLLNEMLLCLRSETVRLWEPVLVIYGPGPFSFEGEARR